MNTKEFDLEEELRKQARDISVEAPRDLARSISAAIASSGAEGASGAANFTKGFSSRAAWGTDAALGTRGQGMRGSPDSAGGGGWGRTGFAGSLRQHWALWSGVGTAVAAALVGAFAFKAPVVQLDTHATAAALAQEVQRMPQRVLASLGQETDLTQTDPLHEEAAGLAQSAQSALGFLAYNFLPTSNG